MTHIIDSIDELSKHLTDKHEELDAEVLPVDPKRYYRKFSRIGPELKHTR